MMSKFMFFVLAVWVFALGLAVPYRSQSDAAEADINSSNSEWTVISSIRSAANYFYDRFIDCSGGSTPTSRPTTITTPASTTTTVVTSDTTPTTTTPTTTTTIPTTDVTTTTLTTTTTQPSTTPDTTTTQTMQTTTTTPTTISTPATSTQETTTTTQTTSTAELTTTTAPTTTTTETTIETTTATTTITTPTITTTETTTTTPVTATTPTTISPTTATTTESTTSTSTTTPTTTTQPPTTPDTTTTQTTETSTTTTTTTTTTFTPTPTTETTITTTTSTTELTTTTPEITTPITKTTTTTTETSTTTTTTTTPITTTTETMTTPTTTTTTTTQATTQPTTPTTTTTPNTPTPTHDLTTATPSTTTTTTTTTPTTTTPSTRSPCNCGLTSRQTLRILGGEFALSPGEFPWQVYIPITSTSGCGGALIHPQWIVSSASCLNSTTSRSVTVKAGVVNVTVPGQNTTGEVIPHPGFTMDPGATQTIPMNNDIALIRLNTAFATMASIQPICLPINEVNNTFVNSKVNMAGWGQLSGLSFKNFTVQADGSSGCSKGSSTNSTFCLTITKSSGPCGNDGGAPVTWYDSIYKRAKLVGMTGRNIQFCQGQGTVRVTRLSGYLDWIRNTTGQVFCTPF